MFGCLFKVTFYWQILIGSLQLTKKQRILNGSGWLQEVLVPQVGHWVSSGAWFLVISQGNPVPGFNVPF